MDRAFRCIVVLIAGATALCLSACGGMTPQEEKQLSSEGHFMDGMAAFNKKDYPQAKELFQTALVEDKNNQKAANALAWAENAMKENGDGQNESNANPNSMSLEDMAKASDISGSTTVGPGGNEAMPPDQKYLQDAFKLGLAQAVAEKSGDWLGLIAAADDYLSQASPDSPLYIDASKLRLQGLVQTEDYAGGADEVTKLLDMDPNADSALLNVATLTYERSGDLDSAVWAAEQAYHLDPTRADSQNNLAYTYAQAGSNLDYARFLAEQSLQTSPYSPAYLDTLGWVLYRSGDPIGAIPYVQQALDLTPPGRDHDEITKHFQAISQNMN